MIYKKNALKTLISILSFVFLISLISILLNMQRNESITSYQFAYIKEGQLGLVNPTITGATPTFFTLPNTTRGAIVAKSPDERWIALAMLVSGQPTTQIEIFDVISGKESSPIQVGHGFFSENQEVDTIENLARGMSWSPDSLHLALSMYGPNHADIFIYSIQTKSVTNLTIDDPNWHYGIGWANSSDRLVTEGESCPLNSNCASPLKLEEFSLAGSLLKAIDVSDLYVGSGGKSICNIKWSPTNNDIAFQSSCDLYRMAPSQEIYVWDLSSNIIQRVTHLTKMGPTDIFGPWADYNILWLNADKILISAAIYQQQNGDTPQMRTFTYEPSTTLQITISANYLDNWSLNPVSGQLAYNMIQLDTTNPNASAASSVKLATIDSNSSSASILQDQPAPLMAQIPNGCDLAWSPDGRYLAFASGPDLAFTTSSQCSIGHVTSIGFVDTQSNTIKEYPLPDDSRTRYYVPIGWVVAAGNGASTVNASATAIGSPAAPGSGSVPGGNQIGG